MQRKGTQLQKKKINFPPKTVPPKEKWTGKQYNMHKNKIQREKKKKLDTARMQNTDQKREKNEAKCPYSLTKRPLSPKEGLNCCKYCESGVRKITFFSIVL